MYCDIPDFGRCCFCLPLRRGILVLGYIHVLFSAFMVGLYSYLVHTNYIGRQNLLMFHGVVSSNISEAPLCVAVYCLEVIIYSNVIIGAHEKHVLCLKIFYYYTLLTSVAVIVIQIVEIATDFPNHFTLTLGVSLMFLGLGLQIYMVILVKSLIKKLEMAGPHVYENELHDIVSGERKVENGVYNNTTVPKSYV